MILNEIDYMCISMRWKSYPQDVRVRRGGDVGSDHYMLALKLHLKLNCMSAKHAECPFAVENLRDAVTAEKFKIKLRNRFEVLEHSQDVEEEWDQMKTEQEKNSGSPMTHGN